MQNKNGFTLFEALIAITVGITLLGLLMSIYILSMKSLNSGQDRAEITQYSRIIIERITRDIRQARDIATILPAISNNAPSEIEIQNGHGSELEYIKYYLSGTGLNRQIRQYYFSQEPEVLVTFDAEDDFGNPAEVNIISDNLIGNYIDSIIYFGENPINIEMSILKNQTKHDTRTSIYGRNL